MDAKGLVEEELTFSVIGAFFEVYNTLGFGFLEHLYGMALEVGLLLHFGPQANFYRMDFRHPSLARAASRNQVPKDKGNSRDKN